MWRRGFLGGGAALAGMGLAAPARAADPDRTIRFVAQADLSSIDPVWSPATVAVTHAMLVFDTLYGVDASLTPQPQMVAGHELSTDGLTWTFTLRDGLRFHDNEPVRAMDCVASIHRWGQRKGFGQKLLSLTDEMKPLDDKRFQIRLKSPYPQMLFAFGGPDICFIMPQRTAQVDAFTQITDAVGSGPFRFLPNERVPGSFAAYAKFDGYVPREEPPSYWAGGKVAHVDRVEWHVLPDPATAASALQRGEVDWVENPLIDLLPMLRAQRDLVLFGVDPLMAPAILVLNHTQPPFDNPKLRQALLPAINQNDFMTALVGDQTDLMQAPVGVFTPGTPLASSLDMQVFSGKRDVARAKQLVAQSGYQGEKVVLMSPSDQPALVPLCQVAAGVMSDLGLNVDFQSMDWATLVVRRALDKPSAQGGWNAFCTSWNGINLSNPGSHLPLRGNGHSGYFGWPVSPKIEALRDQWFLAADEAAQKTICDQMQAVAFDEVPYVPLGCYRLVSAMSRRVQDVIHAGSTCFWGVRKV